MHKYSNKFAVLTCVLAISALSACGGSSNSSSSTDTSKSTDTSPPDTENVVDVVTADQLSKLVCDASPSRMGADAEKYTKESWQCNLKGESVRIDIYKSDEQQAEANQIVLDFYDASGDKKALSDLPIVCGSKWALGVDYNETRDSLISLLSTNGLEASTCK